MGFALVSKTKETPKSTDHGGQEQKFGLEEFTIGSNI